MYNIYHYSVLILGHIGLVLIFIFIINSIYKHIMMKRSSKKYVEAIKNSNFLQKAFEKMTDEEKEIYEKTNGKSQKKVSLNPQTMEVKEEIINGGDKNAGDKRIKE